MLDLSKYYHTVLTPKLLLASYQDSHTEELTDEIKQNAKNLSEHVSGLLSDLLVKEIKITSGWRPQSINSKTPNAAKKSYHTLGLAVDIADPRLQLAGLIQSHYRLLMKWNLWMEHPKHTKTWVHLDLGERTPREVRIFLP